MNHTPGTTKIADATANSLEQAKQMRDERLNNIRELLAAITAALDTAAATANPNWAHVGDLGYVTDQLNEIARFLRAK